MPVANPLQLRISAELVAAFAAATGDRSPVHVDPVQAGRMTFREPVAHGCLCLCFLQALDIDGSPGELALERIQAQFLHPVFIGDPLTLHWTPKRKGDTSELDFRFLRQPSGQCVIQGSLVARRVSAHHDRQEFVAPPELPLSTSDFADLEVGSSEVIGILPNGDALRTALGIPPGRWSSREYYELAMLSPLVGMRLPGRNAVLAQLAMEWKSERLPARRLEGTLLSRSRSVHVLKLAVAFTGDGEAPCAEARVQVRMGKPAIPQPSMAELASLAGVTRDRQGSLAGKTILVTGATGGLGQVLVRLLALNGAEVLIHTHARRDAAEALALEINDIGAEASIVQGDLADPQAVAAICRELDAHPRPLHGLVQNAVGRYQARPLLDTAVERVLEELDIGVLGPLRLAQHVLARMRAYGGGVIVHVGSSVVNHTPPGQLPYVVAKNALLGLARSIHAEFHAENIASYYVAPTLMRTDLTAHLSAGALLEELRGAPGGRLLEPRALAQGMVDLLADTPGCRDLAGSVLLWRDGGWVTEP